ncbi:MAG: SpoIID/LytB domain-containing protein [Blautia sp.]|nr:SpoIID/LytB domain-containing protein [Blautia sp.]MCM1201710.1 SpoIID/LytB domain-containing protein [Bacteroides fragilis]
MKNNWENLVKLLMILAGMVFLFWLWLNRMESVKEEPEGEKIRAEDVQILLEALEIPAVLDTSEDTIQEELTYEQYKEIYEQIGGADKGIPDFAEKYEDGHALLKEDWYRAFQIMLAYFDVESSIWKTTVFIIKVDADEKKLYTQNSEYTYCASSFADSAFLKEEVYVKGDALLTSIRTLDERTILENVWVMEVTGKKSSFTLSCFYRQFEFTVPAAEGTEREQVADLVFEDGKLAETVVKQEKIRGKLLRVTPDSMEIEGCGIYETAENLEIYKLCGTLETQKETDLMIGYDYTDFVVWDGKVCACLVSREGEMDQIRVLLKNTAGGGYYYEKALVTVDGERTEVLADELAEGERLIFQSNALTDKVTLEVEGIQKGDNAYRGALEFYKAGDGMVIINELPLEEYLYAVVPSEMPASYPMEALKAQAVCARTYAFKYILHAGFASLGAHLDDTTSYQVYHNLTENAATTTAVKETTGVKLYYQGGLAENYYYSTSCGYGTDTGIWKSEKEPVSYIRPGKLAPEAAAQDAQSAEAMAEEANFAEFIKKVDDSDFESGEAWYRWTYEVEEMDADALLERIKERYQANAALVLTGKEGADGTYYVSEPIEEIGELQDISVSRRRAGGIADELLITGSETVVKVVSEYNIRRILCDGEGRLVKQDGSVSVPGTLLPSAFFVIEAGKSEEGMIGYTLIGGGYGHGVGMSQNGAKEMGSLGYGYEEILTSFFADCEVY